MGHESPCASECEEQRRGELLDSEDDDCEVPSRYELHAIIHHEGGVKSGHYYRCHGVGCVHFSHDNSDIWNSEKKCWFRHNDSSVTLLDSSKQSRWKETAYILFYVNTIFRH